MTETALRCMPIPTNLELIDMPPALVHASEATLIAMTAKFPHVVLCFFPPRSTSSCSPATWPSSAELQELHPDAGERMTPSKAWP